MIALTDDKARPSPEPMKAQAMSNPSDETDTIEHKVAYAAFQVALSVSAMSALAKNPQARPLIARDVIQLHAAQVELRRLVHEFMPGLLVTEAAE
jgi:hypothetical protein